MRVLAILLIASLAVAAHAIQAPRFPAQASYKLQGNLDQNGGRLAGVHYHDLDLGFVRWDQSYIDDTGAETLLEIAIWDLNANKVTYMTPAAENSPVMCITAPTLAGYAPTTPDFSSWKFSNYNFQGSQMTETWVDAFGGVMQVEAFTRLPVLMANTTSIGGDSTSIVWNDIVPNGDVFMVPSLLQCQQSNDTVTANANIYSPFVNRRALGLPCNVCKFIVGTIIGKGCSAAARALCLLTAELAPVCGIIMSIICQGACSGAACAQRVCHTIRLC